MILLIGANGQLGTDILKVYDKNYIIPVTHSDVEITNKEDLKNIVKKYNTTCIINTAAYHNVPKCEKNPEKAFLVNAVALKNMMEICREYSITLVHISTDYVFDGLKNTPYYENDNPVPLNTYGISKLAGEFFVKLWKKHYIIRVASLFGVNGCRAKNNMNFVENIIKKANTEKEIFISSNVYSSPTYTFDVAYKIKEIIGQSFPYGTYHIVNSDGTSWYEFAKEIVKEKKLGVKISPKTEDVKIEGVKRPLYSVLKSNKITPMRSWKDALKDYLKERRHD